MNKAVYEIQQNLRNISRLDSDISSVIPDGIFGTETTEAVKAFQKKHGLNPTGKVDYDTWERLAEENRRVLSAFSEPISVAPAKNSDFPLQEGKKSHLNKNLNLMLSHFSDFFSDFYPMEITDEFTEATTEQVMTFQKITDNEADGIVSKEIWSLISSLYLLLSSD